MKMFEANFYDVEKIILFRNFAVVKVKRYATDIINAWNFVMKKGLLKYVVFIRRV